MTDTVLAPPRFQIRIEPPSGWGLPDFRELWAYRELLGFLIWRDVKVRYKQTVLGVAWAVLQPAMMMVMFVILFGRIAKLPTGGVPQPLFFLTGALPWFFFSTALTSASNSVLGAERLITKIYFPRLIVPLSAIGAAVIDLLVGSSLLVLMLIYYGAFSISTIHYALVSFLLLTAIASGLGTFLAALNVAFRDFRYVIPFMVQITMFSTPTIYMQPTGDETGIVAVLLKWNPLAPVIATFRAGILGGPIPWLGLLWATIVAVGVTIAGSFYFRKQEDRFADTI